MGEENKDQVTIAERTREKFYREELKNVQNETPEDTASRIAALKLELLRTSNLAHEDELVPLKNKRGLIDDFKQIVRILRSTEHELQGENLKAVDKRNIGFRGYTVVVIDMIGLKKVNTEKGEKRGDELLTELSHGLRKMGRSTDLYARLRGDEFVFVSINTLEDSREGMVDLLRENLAGVKVNLLVATFTEDNLEDNLQDLQNSMEEHKQKGKLDEDKRSAGFGVVYYN